MRLRARGCGCCSGWLLCSSSGGGASWTHCGSAGIKEKNPPPSHVWSEGGGIDGGEVVTVPEYDVVVGSLGCWVSFVVDVTEMVIPKRKYC